MSCNFPKSFKFYDFNGTRKVKYLPYYELDINSDYFSDDIVWLPCGKCVECRLAHSRMWANRAVLESSYWEYNFFITLTYSDENLPLDDLLKFTLKKRDIVLFHKRLRKYYSDNLNHFPIRFMLAGEYGSKFSRPHYHGLYFNLPLDDLKFYKKSFDGHNLYNSPLIDRIWGKGYAVISYFSWKTAAYVARYTLKKVENNIDYGMRVPEYFVMSRRPGIGARYYHDNKSSIYHFDKILINNSVSSFYVQPFRYFDKLLKKDDDYLYNSIKEIRKGNFKYFSRFEFISTDKSVREYLDTRDSHKRVIISKFKKKL